VQLRFPISDVKIEISKHKKEVVDPLFDDGFFRLNQNEFSMNVEDVGWFYASSGNYVSMVLNPKATISMIELYLNGSTYGAILHQRKIMPMHGSCFVYDNKGIMLCGESGAGKSSLTAAFCYNGSTFLTDDVTPLVFFEGLPFITPSSDRIKLWEDSLKQLSLEKDGLKQINEDYQKFYLPFDSTISEPYPLDMVFIIEKQDNDEVKFQELRGIERFTALRNEIYRWEYLEGMKESEASYLNYIVNISNNVKVVKVLRPEKIKIETLRSILSDKIANQVHFVHE
jgi:GTPase SAR1 family protein